VTTTQRSEALPDVPTVSESLPGYEKLNKEINAGLGDPRIKARLADLGSLPLSMMPSDFGKLIADETEKWGKVVKLTGIKAD
jgi:tripartite-type tricarboxylate transporter receptor subunit TctC